MNPFDEIGMSSPSFFVAPFFILDSLTSSPLPLLSAVEEALRLREKSPKLVTSITALTIGPTKSVETLRTALAMGADSGIHILTPDSQPSSPEPLGVARAIAHIAKEKKIDLIILGKQAIDDDSGATGGMVAGILGWGQGCFASKLEIQDGGLAKVTREIDGGLEKVEAKLPLIITTDLRLNGKFLPIYPVDSFPQIHLRKS